MCSQPPRTKPSAWQTASTKGVPWTENYDDLDDGDDDGCIVCRLLKYSLLPNVGTGAFIWQILPIWQIWYLQIWDWPTWQNLPNKGTGTYIWQARVIT